MSSASSASGAEPCCSQIVPANAGRTARIRRRQVDTDRKARAQTQLGALGDTDDIAAGAQRVEDAPLTDPLQMFGRPGAAQDRQPAQFVGFVAGRRVREHVGLIVLDADHPAGAVGDRLGEPEQVGARVVVRVAAVAMVLEGVVDESVERLPPRPRLDGHDRGAERDGPPDRGIRGFLDEDGRGHAPGSGELLFQPAHRIGVGDAQQEEEVRGTGPTARPSRTSSASTRATEPTGISRPRGASTSVTIVRSRASNSWPSPRPGVGAAITPSFVRFDYKSDQVLCRIGHRFEPAENGDPYCMDAITDVPLPANEPIHDYAPGSGERSRLADALSALAADPVDLPHVIGGTHRMGGGTRTDVVQPHRHSARLGTFTNAEHADATAAIDAAIAAKAGWEATPFDERAAVFLRAADLLAGPWREKIARQRCSASPRPPIRPRSTRRVS